ncbi:MAG TPA: hypothetical protein VFS21_25320 [Roseiflexaceae bacterium]|nr:hypothetical protein [Roseiflexaceae bacterium]
MLLLLTSAAHAPVAAWMEAECARRGVPHLRLYTEEFPQEIELSARPTEAGLRGSLACGGGEIALDTIGGVWQYLAAEVQPDPELDEVAARLVQQESRETLRGLYRALEHVPWINPPHIERAAGHRAYQLRLAAQLGLRTPRTLITNRPDHAATFLEECGGQMVYKPISPLVLTDADGEPTHVAYVTPITRESLSEHAEGIALSPCLFQEIVPKQRDLTVYVVGRRVWATAIESDGQTDEVDYRRGGLWSRPHRPALLPPALERRCVQLTQRMGLRMCNFDFVQTPDGEYVFLDANPTDLWAAIEQLVGFPICASIVDELLGVDTLADHPYLRDRALEFAPSLYAMPKGA